VRTMFSALQIYDGPQGAQHAPRFGRTGFQWQSSVTTECRMDERESPAQGGEFVGHTGRKPTMTVAAGPSPRALATKRMRHAVVPHHQGRAARRDAVARCILSRGRAGRSICAPSIAIPYGYIWLHWENRLK
jgi:hypothetical protein